MTEINVLTKLVPKRYDQRDRKNLLSQLIKEAARRVEASKANSGQRHKPAGIEFQGIIWMLTALVFFSSNHQVKIEL
jgi:hypothetical protein